MTDTARQIDEAMHALADPEQAAFLMRFFKTGPGQYGEGDRFLGLRAPETRSVVRQFRKSATEADVDCLVRSPWHEVRLAALLLLIEIYRRNRRKPAEARRIVAYYLSLISFGNNWDLVDMVAPKILGDYLCFHPEERDVLHRLAAMDGSLWHQRVAIVATWTLIRDGSFDEALDISRLYLTHSHDLIHKGSGWMLREIGKRGGEARLLEFLDRHAAEMPRTMLRYSIEKLPPSLRKHYMALPRTVGAARP